MIVTPGLDRLTRVARVLTHALVIRRPGIYRLRASMTHLGTPVAHNGVDGGRGPM